MPGRAFAGQRNCLAGAAQLWLALILAVQLFGELVDDLVEAAQQSTDPLVEMVRKRQVPVIGGGTGVWSFIEITDAAAATIAAVGHGPPGIYNIVDDDPAPVSGWLPYLAQVAGAKPPLRLPAWLGRLLAGEFAVAQMTTSRGSSNQKARKELGWVPRYSSWREGFRAWVRG